jgi:hypothetical protein
MTESHNEQGYILCAYKGRSGPTREFRTTVRVTQSDAWYDAKDDARNGTPPDWIGPVTDNLTGDQVWFRPAACGAGCYCAAAYRTTKPRRVHT